MNCGEIYVLLLTVMPVIFADTDYCNPSYCGEGTKHIACHNNGDFSHFCLVPIIVPITPLYRRQIVREHNLLRNKIAKGFKMFPPAKRMATMMWDNELAKLAEFNVKQCVMLYDQCCNTPKFLYAGQNIGITRWSGVNLTVSEVISNQIRAWFREYIYCPLDVIRSYTSANSSACGRFTTMVQEKSTHIGCAILRSFKDGFIQQIMTCNYAYDTLLDEPVYSSGRTASLCTTGTNMRFTSLCSVRERYYY